jgi:hypothetical protein
MDTGPGSSVAWAGKRLQAGRTCESADESARLGATGRSPGRTRSGGSRHKRGENGRKRRGERRLPETTREEGAGDEKRAGDPDRARSAGRWSTASRSALPTTWLSLRPRSLRPFPWYLILYILFAVKSDTLPGPTFCYILISQSI